MPFCESCGNNIAEEDKFCRNCGERVNATSLVPEVLPEEPKWNLETFLEENPPNEKGIITCPRCLGKGIVDNDDIKRLLMEHNWTPGHCLYCDGVGLVNVRKTSTVVVNETLHLSDAQIRNLTTLSKVVEQRQGAFCFYDTYNFGGHFGHLTSDSNIFFKDGIPNVNLNAFLSRYQYNSENKAYFKYSSEYSPYVYFEDSSADKGEIGFLLVVLDQSDDWFDNGDIILMVNKVDTSFAHPTTSIEKIGQEDSKLVIEYDDQGLLNSIQFPFANCAPVLSALVNFFNDLKSNTKISDIEEDEELDDEHVFEDQSPIKPKDGAGIR